MGSLDSHQHDHDSGKRNGVSQPSARPKLAHLRSFVHLARLGSMTATAAALGSSQPTISDHIEQLERGFDDKLFIRRPTGVVLTATGEMLLRRIDRPLTQLDNLTFKSLSRPVLLGGPHDILHERVLPTLAPLLSTDGICVQIRPGIAEELLVHLTNRMIDLFIATRRLNTHDIKVRYHRLFQEEYVLVGNAQWKKRFPPMATEDDAVHVLSKAPFLAFDDDLPIIRDHPLIAEHEDAIFGADPCARVALVMPNFGALRNVAIEGGGVTVLPRYLAEDAIQAKQLYELYRPEDRKFNPIYLAQRDEPQNDAVGRIINELRTKAPSWETKEAKAAATALRSPGPLPLPPPAPFYDD